MDQITESMRPAIDPPAYLMDTVDGVLELLDVDLDISSYTYVQI